MFQEEIELKINTGSSTLYKYEGDLIKNRCKEEAICAHLICYLKELFKPWNVDLEYNRDGFDSKRDSSDNIVYPDIIIHNRTPDRIERFSPENNLAVVEVKGFWNDRDRVLDENKLRDMKETYGYQYAFRLELEKERGNLILVK